jgi:hypothetical protein
MLISTIPTTAQQFTSFNTATMPPHYLPLLNHHSHLMTIYNLTVITNTGKKPPLLCSKEVTLFWYIFFGSNLSSNTVGHNQKFWMIDVGEQHFEEWYTHHIYTLLTWVIYSGPEETNDPCGKMMYIRTIVNSTALSTLSCKINKILNLWNIVNHHGFHIYLLKWKMFWQIHQIQCHKHFQILYIKREQTSFVCTERVNKSTAGE